MTRIQTNIAALDRQLGSLVGRLSELPDGVSALPIYQHMKKVEDEKKQLMTVSEKFEANGKQLVDEVPELHDYREFVKSVERFWRDSNDSATKAKAIAALVHKIEVSREELKIHFYVGKSQIGTGAPLGGASSTRPTDPSAAPQEDGSKPLHDSQNKILKFGSNSLKNGRGFGV